MPAPRTAGIRSGVPGLRRPERRGRIPYGVPGTRNIAWGLGTLGQPQFASQGAGPASVSQPRAAHPEVSMPCARAARSPPWSAPVCPPLMTRSIMEIQLSPTSGRFLLGPQNPYIHEFFGELVSNSCASSILTRAKFLSVN